MQTQFTGLLLVLCVHVLKCHLATGNLFNLFPSINPHEDCKGCGGVCLSPTLICDGISNCEDGSDEENCDFIKCRLPKYFKCRDSKCINVTDVCNKLNDCEGGEDEENCDKEVHSDPNTCAKTEFRCDNNLCIPLTWTCDGVADCGDGSDETRGCEKKTCKDHEFKCNNSKCIPLSFRCDGNPDCEDLSDEEHCGNKGLGNSNCITSRGKFACKDNSKCIDLSKACDGSTDCLDGSDEGGMCTSDARHQHCKNCTHRCFLTPKEAVCSCFSGFVLLGNDTCKDINECKEYGICDQKCSNTEGSYNCICESPYKLQSDKRTCKINGGDAVLFYSSESGLKGIHLRTNANYSIVDYNGISLGVSIAGTNMYWTTFVDDTAKIYRASTYDYVPHEMITSGLGYPEDIDVDWITGNIYFTDSKFKHIGVCDSNGRHCVVLHQKNIDKPRSISLSPETGILFWTDWGSTPMVGKSGMDGSKAETFVTKNIHWPNGISTDTPNERVYWVDAKHRIIESIKFDGSDRRVVSSDYVDSPYSISVFENKLYWSNWDGNEISECDKFTGKNKKSLIRNPSHKIFGIHVDHSLRNVKDIGNPCVSNLCSDLCLLSPDKQNRLTYSCACPENKELSENSKTCHLKKNSKFLIAAYKNDVYLTEPQFLGRTSFKKFSLDVESISSMAYDYLKGALIVADSKSAYIKSYNFSTEKTATLHAGGATNVPSLQYDDYGNNLYWCNFDYLTVEAMDLNTFSKTVILWGTISESPVEIALVPSKGYMFIAYQLSYARVQIDRISMDGSLTSRNRFLNDDSLSPNLKMFYDLLEKRLFFADITKGLIESVNEYGGDRILHAKDSNLFSFTSVEGALFWTTEKSPFINWKEISDETKHVRRIKLDVGEMYDNEGIIITNPSNYHPFIPSTSCLKNNGGCSHICLVSSESPNKPVCACPLGEALAADGQTCHVPRKCSSTQYTCFTGECISSSKLCDRRKDCLHGEDEILENCHACPKEQFLCNDRTKCIDTKLRCDGKFDCEDQSDEVCHINCTEGMFKCDNGECIESQFRCDGKVDCKDGLDERNCHLSTCKTNEFRCTSGQCIHHTWYCDGQPDCTDGSDEMANCTFGPTCRADEFHCSNGRCVNISVTCDRHDDCGDNSDEDKECIKNPYIYKQPVWYSVDHHLHVFKQCNSRIEFQCPTKLGKHCIPKASRCDGIVNCLNGEDEENCSSNNKCAHDHEFFCNNTGRCIPDEWVCDHNNDCGDNSDEAAAACVKKNVTKTACAGFQCANGECISLSKICDEVPDCSDKSDEGGSCGSGCEKFGCSHKCHESPKGQYCTCEHGYTLGHDNKTCVDIDECTRGICAQNCTNTPGSFVCSCFSSEYTLKSDRVTCKANGEAAHFVIASLDEINIIENNWMRTFTVLKLPTGSMITAMDVNSKQNIVYTVWDYSTIVRMDFLSSENKMIFAPLIYGIAADWITDNVYYIKDHNKIMVASFSGNNSSIVHLVDKSFKILSIATDPVAGYLFWYESYGDELGYRNVGIIKRADCNGANVINITTLIENTIEYMNVDSYEKYLYLYEKYQSTIVRLNYDGSNASIVLRIEPHVIGFSFFENSIYWASENSDVYPIRKCKVYGLPPRKCEVIRSRMTNVRYFAVLQKSHQRIVLNPCEATACSGICTSSPTGPKCLLFDGRSFSIDNPSQFPEKIESASSFSTIFAYFVVLCLIAALVFFGYRYYKPKSQFFHRFHYNTSLNRSEQLYTSQASGINEMVTNKSENPFLESVTEETIDSKLISSRHKSSRESLLNSNL